jgi:hypothetical protein
MRPVSASGGGRNNFDEFKDDIEAVERRMAREFDPGVRALVIAILVFVILLSFILPHTGGANGWEALVSGEDAVRDRVTLPSRVFVWLVLVFSAGFSMLALLTRRWAVAWVALAGSAVASALGLLAVWSRQTAGEYPGPGVGLIVAWFAVIVLTYHWVRVVWARTAVQLAAEEERRRAVAERQKKGLLDDLGKERPPNTGDKPDNGPPQT